MLANVATREGVKTTVSHFDELTKAFSAGMSRRGVVKVVGASVLGSVLATVTGVTAFADDDDFTEDARCPCHNIFVCDPNEICSADGSCGCVPKNVNPARGFCHQGQSCSGLVSCSTNRDCRQAGLAGWKCAQNSCCGTGPVCLPCCGAAAGAAKGGGKTTLG